MKKRIVMIDAIRVVTDELDKVFSEIIPDAEVLHIVDEGIIQFNDPESKLLARRFCNLAVASEEVGADVILITCAHGIPFVNTVQMLVGPPVLQITLPMIDAAVSKAERIGLVATEEPIIKPIRNLLERAGEKLNKAITVKAGLCEEAFKARLSGNTARSDELLLKTIKDLSKAVDVIVLAQVSSATPAATPAQSASLRVLVELPLADQPADRELEADDAAEQPLDVVLGGVGHLPGLVAVRLVVGRQPGDVGRQPGAILDEAEPAVGVDHDVVPLRRDPAGLLLAGVPVGRDVAARPLEDHQRLEVRRGVAPHPVAAGDVPAEGAVRGRRRIEIERQVVGEQPAGAEGDDGGERLVPHQRVHRLDARFLEVLRHVHRIDSRRCAEQCDNS